MLRGTILNILFFAGCAAGIVAGYYIESPTRIKAYSSVTSTAIAMPEQPVYYSANGMVQKVDTLNSKLILVMASPYAFGNTITISAAYDEKTVFSGTDGATITPSQLEVGQKVRFGLLRASGPLHVNSILAS